MVQLLVCLLAIAIFVFQQRKIYFVPIPAALPANNI